MASAIVPEVLNQHNYNDWSSRLQTYLLAEDLWNVVKENEPHSESEKGKAVMSDKAAWGTKNAKALHAIKISCGTEMFSFIRQEHKAKKAWEILEYKFKSPDILLQKIDEKNEIPQLFFDHVENGDWDNAKKCLGTAEIPKTALHQAVIHRRVKAVKELVNMMSEEDLKTLDGEGRTALCCTVVAWEDDGGDFIEMASYMVQRNKEILEIGFPPFHRIPVVSACGWSKFGMARYLYSVTPPSLLLAKRGEQGAQLICTCIRYMKGLDIAWTLLQDHPWLAVACNKYHERPMSILAGARNGYLSGERLTFWQKLIYHSIHTQPVDLNNHDSWINVSKSKEDQGNQRDVNCSGMFLF